ncbi:MAG: tRNA lysidine(34) synthetase TilS [Pirellulaceae bacterium]
MAVSGGADSVALAHGLVALRTQLPSRETVRGELILAHFNHRLRQQESDEDQRFVQGLAERLGCQAQIEGAPSGWQNQSREGLGTEGAARMLRYAFLQRVATSVSARYVVTAHHRDDQVETVLLRLFRGTGVGGLAGMSASRELSPGVGLVRPLLGISRAEIRDYLHAANLDFREDLSNNDPRFTRNRMRNRVLPLLRKEFGCEVDEAISRLAKLAGECQELIQGQAEQMLADSLVSRGEDQIVLQFSAPPLPSPYLLRETLILTWKEMDWPLRDMTGEHWRKLADLATGEPPAASQMFPGKIQAQNKGGQLSLARLR